MSVVVHMHLLWLAGMQPYFSSNGLSGGKLEKYGDTCSACSLCKQPYLTQDRDNTMCNGNPTTESLYCLKYEKTSTNQVSHPL